MDVASPLTIPLWPNGAPGTEHWTHEEQITAALPPFDIPVVRNVVQPSLTAFLPDPARATGTAVIVCPGGAFHFLAIDHEGYDVARWLNERGVAAFVLRYRVIPTKHDDQEFMQQVHDTLADRENNGDVMREAGLWGIADGRQAVRLVRQRSTEWGIAPDRIGIMGFSAGGVVAAGVAALYDAASRPDFAAPIYPAPWQIGTLPDDAPPLFIAVASDDAFAASACIPLYTTWTTAGHSAELHVYAKGAHGFGMFTQGLPTDHWIDRFGDWLQQQGFFDTNQGEQPHE